MRPFMPFISLFGMVKQHLKASQGHSSQVLVIIKYHIPMLAWTKEISIKKPYVLETSNYRNIPFWVKKKNLYLEGECVLRQKNLPTLRNFCNPGPLCIEPESPYISFNLECLIFFYNLLDWCFYFFCSFLLFKL